jgi:hypothetical protein
VYASSTSALATGSALVFTGTNLGIGNSSPTYSLDVVNNQNSQTVVGIKNTNSGTTAQSVFFTDNGTSTTQFGTTGTGYTTFGALTANCGYIYQNSQNFVLQTNSGSQIFATGNVERMRLNTSGYLGIGTSSPSYSLDIVNNQNANTVASITNNNAGTTAQAIFYTANGSSLTQFGTTGTGYTAYGSLTANSGYLYSTAPNFVLMANNASSPIIFASGGNSEKMRLDTSGNLGLGVTPSAWDTVKPLQMANGSIYGFSTTEMGVSQNMYYGSGQYRYIATAVASTYRQISGVHSWHTAPSGTAGNAISFTQAMTLDNSGNLAIGTTSPAGYRLRLVSSSSDADVVRWENSGGTIYGLLGVSTTNSLCYAGTGTSNSFAFITNNTERMRISSTGGLSVGTTANPGAGAIYATSNITAFYSSDAKFKENVQDIQDPLGIVTAIGSKTFDWTDEYLKDHGGENEYFLPKQSFGVIAQDVQKVFPQAVRTREDGSLAVDYEKLAILSFGAIGQLLKRVEALENTRSI